MHWPRWLPRFGANITEGKWFEMMVRKSFDEVDLDKDGRLDYKELYIGLLKLYDLLNHKLPAHIKVPNLNDINSLMRKYDVDDSGKLEYKEYLTLCKGLIGNKKDWKDSLFLKIALAVALKTLGFPYLGGALKGLLSASGVEGATQVPTGMLTFMVEQVGKRVLPIN